MPHPATGGATITNAWKVIRMARHGCTNRPFYHIVVMNRKSRRQDLCIEQLGTYDPMPNVHNERLCALNMERLTYWIGKKVHLTKGVAELLGKAGFLPIHPRTYTDGWRNRKKIAEEKEMVEKSKEEGTNS